MSTKCSNIVLYPIVRNSSFVDRNVLIEALRLDAQGFFYPLNFFQ